MRLGLAALRRALPLCAVALLCLAGTAQALSVSGPSTVTMPGKVTFSMGTDPQSDVSVTDIDSGSNAGGCWSDDNGACSVTLDYGLLSSSTTTKTFKFVATPSGEMAQRTVTFVPPSWGVALNLSGGEGVTSVTMPAPAPLSVSVTPQISSPYWLGVYDADTGEYAGLSCRTDGGVCTGQLDGGWHDHHPITKHYVAKLLDGGTVIASNSLTVDFSPPAFGLAIAAPSLVRPHSPVHVEVTNVNHHTAPERIIIRNADNQFIGGCGIEDEICAITDWSGDAGSIQGYYAQIGSGAGTMAQTPVTRVWTIDPDHDAVVQSVNIDALALMYGSAAAVCDAILPLPGTHTIGSPTDQYLACDGVAASGGSSEVALRAVLGALIGASGAQAMQSLVAYLQHHAWSDGGTTTYPPLAPPTFPRVEPQDPPVAPPAVQADVDALAQGLLARSAAIALAGTATAEEVAKRCLWSTGAAGLPADSCGRLPTYFPGSDLPATTNHRADAIYGTLTTPGWPAWTLLTRRVGDRGDWHRNQPECKANPDPATLSCDEYPYATTYQGGGRELPRPSLSVLDRVQNHTDGSKWGGFLRRCNIPDSGALLVVPLRPALGIPTINDACAP
jgi:hypothetical protein